MIAEPHYVDKDGYWLLAIPGARGPAPGVCVDRAVRAHARGHPVGQVRLGPMVDSQGDLPVWHRRLHGSDTELSESSLSSKSSSGPGSSSASTTLRTGSSRYRPAGRRCYLARSPNRRRRSSSVTRKTLTVWSLRQLRPRGSMRPGKRSSGAGHGRPFNAASPSTKDESSSPRRRTPSDG